MPRNFYIIGHNPNKIEEAEEYLKNGANALEPDICYHEDEEDKFIVHENISQIPDFIERIFEGEVLSLKKYLTFLTSLLKKNPEYKVSLIAFDLKPDYNYDINDLYKVIRENFSDHFPDIAILTTVNTPDAMPFLAKLSEQRINEAVGVDEHSEPEEVHNFFKNKNLKYTFAAGSTVVSPAKDKFINRVKRAIKIRDKDGFKFVHTWSVNDTIDIMNYLDLPGEIDAILTDEPHIVKSIIESDKYTDRFKLTEPGYNPFK